MEYNAVKLSIFVVFADQPKIITATANIFYRRLTYAGPDIIAYLPGEHITVIGQGLSTMDYYMCGLAKTY